MFETDKSMYMTKAVSEELGNDHQQFIIQYLLENQSILTDYLQVFEFYIENDKQWLIQRQEEPSRETTIFVGLENNKPIKRTVWVIDQGNEIVILFPEDY
ncbi:DUF960 family protein [Bacillus sp. CGMCC 1.16607]|uniref:DUF960 family protein n=1 Tax=Bacillus sp. CGMCC 1.16607 TaxID=3351842 RepID=UPI00363FAC78